MPQEIDRRRAQELLAEGARFLDVLPAPEYAESHLPGALNLPLKRLGRETASALEPDAPVVVYCHDSR